MEKSWITGGGIAVERRVEPVDGDAAVAALTAALDERRGALLASSCEVPGRYARFDVGFVDPPLALEGAGRELRLRALSERGAELLAMVGPTLAGLPVVEKAGPDEGGLRLRVRAPRGAFAEEERSRQPSPFSVVRALRDAFAAPGDPHLGLYGAFGYDLAFAFEPIPRKLPRPEGARDLVLYLPDELVVVDHRTGRAERRRYEFAAGGHDTRGRAAGGAPASQPPPPAAAVACDHAPGAYEALVERAKEAFARGDLFEVVPSQTFREPCRDAPSEVFSRLRRRNPAPYGFLLNLGRGEHLVGASPEMYVRVRGRRVETRPIAGTIRRGADALGDAARIRELLASEKDECELTMCTDVDRNDKSRVCEPGSVRILERRTIEIASRLIHTVDHVEGTLRPGFDALDAFLTHAWAVTVTGAPKRAALAFLEENERSPRAWYGGAVGRVGFDGDLDTGLTLRTIRVKDGVAEVRVGATLLFASDPKAEEAETRLKASALLDAIRRRDEAAASPEDADAAVSGCTGPRPGVGRRVLLVDCQDSFVHTLADYFRRTGAKVKTLRVGFPADELRRLEPDLVVLSPGPGRPADFGLDRLLGAALARGLPVFGVCLGLQAIAEHFGARLVQLPVPRHGVRSRVSSRGGRLLRALPPAFEAGRYHSLAVDPASLPGELRVCAVGDDDVVMALEHRTLPVAGVQFHPESLLTLEGERGLRLLETVVGDAPVRPRERVSREAKWAP